MCLAIPTRIIELLDNQNALISLSGVEKIISLALLKDKPKVGDYVIVHVGYALNILNEEDANKTLAYFNDMLSEEEKN